MRGGRVDGAGRFEAVVEGSAVLVEFFLVEDDAGEFLEEQFLLVRFLGGAEE